MKTEDYDESKVLNEFLTRNFFELMTDLERRSYDLALKREKADHSSAAAERLPVWIAAAAAGADAETMSLQGRQALSARFGQRIQRDLWGGQIVINRCPRCSRIVKTPLARQCLWCGYDWHDT